jgi:hypothetical protein
MNIFLSVAMGLTISSPATHPLEDCPSRHLCPLDGETHLRETLEPRITLQK